MKIPKEKSLLVINPELAKEWHPTKNGELKPMDFLPMSNKKVWWLGKCGHEWEATISHRSNSRGCPYCASQKLLVGYNDLKTKNSELAKEWHLAKNGSLTPANIFANSNKKFWWVGKCGHEWEASVAHRNNGKGCPFCAGQKILIGFNDLASTNSDLADEWHPSKNSTLKPTDISAGSDKKVWWFGKCGHEWCASINSRVHGNGCQICAKEMQTSFPEQAIYFYLKKIFPDAVNTFKLSNEKFEIDIYIESLKLGIEYDGSQWHKYTEKDKRKNVLCKDANITLLRIREPKCPIIDCCGTHCFQLTDYSMKSLKEATYKVFAFITKNITNIEYFIAIDIESDTPAINNLFIQKQKQSSLFTVSPNLAREWHPNKNGRITADMISAYSNRKAWWLGKCGHEWQATVNSRMAGNGCPVCNGKMIVKGYNDLATLSPKLVQEWDYSKNLVDPNIISPNSHKKAWWKCNKCGRDWEAQIKSRNMGNGCICDAKQRQLDSWSKNNIDKKGSLLKTNPQLANEWHPTNNGDLTPNDISAGSDKRIWWLCGKCKHEWEAHAYTRKAGSGCPRCWQTKRKRGDF